MFGRLANTNDGTPVVRPYTNSIIGSVTSPEHVKRLVHCLTIVAADGTGYHEYKGVEVPSPDLIPVNPMSA